MQAPKEHSDACRNFAVAEKIAVDGTQRYATVSYHPGPAKSHAAGESTQSRCAVHF